MSSLRTSSTRGIRGSSVVEFALVVLMTMVLVLGTFEISRMVLVYNSLAGAAQVGVRYATVHGTSGSAVATASQVCSTVSSYTQVGLVGSLTCGGTTGGRIVVSWPDTPQKDPGSRVKVTVVYPYDPWVGLPLSVNLSSTAQGIITY